MRQDLEIMFDDLTPDAQKAVLDFYGLDSASDGNYDVFPLFVLSCEEGEDDNTCGCGDCDYCDDHKDNE